MKKSYIEELEEEQDKLIEELGDLARVNVPYNNPHYKYLRQRLDLVHEMILSCRRQKY